MDTVRDSDVGKARNNEDAGETSRPSPAGDPLQRAQTEALSYVLDGAPDDLSADFVMRRNQTERKAEPAVKSRSIRAPGAVAVYPTNNTEADDMGSIDDNGTLDEVSSTKEVTCIEFDDEATEASTDLDSSRFVARARVVSDDEDNDDGLDSFMEEGTVVIHPKLERGTESYPIEPIPTLVTAEPIEENDITLKQIVSNRKVQCCIMIICLLMVGLTVGLIVGLQNRGGGRGQERHGGFQGPKGRPMPRPLQTLGDKHEEQDGLSYWNDESRPVPKKGAKKGMNQGLRHRASRKARDRKRRRRAE